MVLLKRMICCALLLPCLNAILLIRTLGVIAGLALCAVLGIFYVCLHIFALCDRAPTRRLQILKGGYELTLASGTCFLLEIFLYMIVMRVDAFPARVLIGNGVLCALLLSLLLLGGLLRIFLCSTQVGIVPKLLLLFLWWMPVLNVLLLRQFMQRSAKEYSFSLTLHLRNEERSGEELCKTKYPLLMVHGIFFRDWEKFNYWGRVPEELIRNGAVVFYGGHQSSSSVEQCGGELRQSILDIVEQTGCEKVNIIAHSKGGLDSRYAISCLGMGTHVASLTTINTPHTGCNYVGKLLDIIPQKTVAGIGKKYESLFTKLGDNNPDFFSGLRDLTDQECARLNALMPDDPAVLYQSVGSRMRSFSSAMFPLNVGYALIKSMGGGENDGLAPTAAMQHGNFLGVISPAAKQGISHGDVIDLTRMDIEGFDIREFYVDFVHQLKEKGL